MPTFRRSLSRRTLLTASALAAFPAAADTWPAKAVHIIVPFAPGGSGDITARLVGKYMEDKTGQPFVVENKPGANGIVGVLAVKAAAPDGYTLMLATTSTNAANIHMFKSPGYDPATDFSVVGVIGSSGAFLVVPADSPFKTLADLLVHAKANPSKLTYGSAGIGSFSQLVCELLHSSIGVSAMHVPFRATALAMQEVIAGRIDYLCPVTAIALPNIESNQVKPIAMLSKSRPQVLPKLATAHEQGLVDFDAYFWDGIFLPKRTPLPIVQKLHAATIATLDTAAVQERLKDIGATTVSPERRSPEYLQNFVVSEIAKWGAAIKAANIKME